MQPVTQPVALNFIVTVLDADKTVATSIQTIAQEAGLSKATVSRALRDHPDISTATKERVLAIAERQGYEPNHIAKALSTKRTQTIGVILPHIRYTFFAEILHGIEGVFSEAGYNILLASSHESASKELAMIREFAAKQVDGLLISVSAETLDAERFDLIDRKKIPYVFFDRLAPTSRACQISVNYSQLYDQKIQHLVEMGFRDVCHLAGRPRCADGVARLAAFKQAAAKYDLCIKPERILMTDGDEASGSRALRELHEQGRLPEVIDTSSTISALGVLKAARQLQLRIPEDLALCANYVTPITDLLLPRLTGVRMSAYDMGEKAARMLLDLINDRDGKLWSQHVQLATELVVGESTRRNA